jgi:hypothetical protein
VEAAVVASDDEAALRQMLDPAFDPSRTVVLAEGDAVGAPASTAPEAVRIERIGADRVRLDASLSGAGFVVLADAWTPGWTARVDGQEARVLRANVAFRAVPVSAGRHTVELRYRAPGLTAGLALTGFTLAALTGTALRSRTRRREVEAS